MLNKRIFISGGAGVIGSEIVPRLAELGATLLVGDLKPRPKTFPAQIQYRQGDLNYLSQNEINAFAPEVFIHLAATFERSTESPEFWEENFWHNLRLSHHLMSLVKNTPRIQRVVFASSYLIYDPGLYQFDEAREEATRLKEDAPILPRNLTGMAKLAHEIELRFLDQHYSSQFSTVCARIFRGFGCNSRDVISRWVRALLNGERLSVYQPENQFDYIYAADTASGLIRLAETESLSGIINLGTGNPRKVQDVLDILRTHFPHMQIAPMDSPGSPYEASAADTTKLQECIGWTPNTPLEQAIEEIIAFEQARHNATPPSQQKLKVLISSASRKAPLVRAMLAAARRIAPDALVVAGDSDPASPTAYIADEFWAMPKTHDAFFPEIIAGCKARGISVVLPSRDGELEFWARHAKAFAAMDIQVLVSSEEALIRCLDKLEFSRFGSQNKLPFIPTYETIQNSSVQTWVVKERFGAGSRALGLNLSTKAASDHAATLQHPIFQPYIAGEEISIDAWLDSSCKLKGVILRRREQVLNGESQITTTFRSPELEEIATSILERLGLRGHVVMQGIVDANDKLHIIECNARFGGASTTAIAVGLDSLYWSLQESIGTPVNTLHFERHHQEVRQVRLPADIHFYLD